MFPWEIPSTESESFPPGLWRLWDQRLMSCCQRTPVWKGYSTWNWRSFLLEKWFFQYVPSHPTGWAVWFESWYLNGLGIDFQIMLLTLRLAGLSHYNRFILYHWVHGRNLQGLFRWFSSDLFEFSLKVSTVRIWHVFSNGRSTRWWWKKRYLFTTPNEKWRNQIRFNQKDSRITPFRNRNLFFQNVFQKVM